MKGLILSGGKGTRARRSNPRPTSLYWATTAAWALSETGTRLMKGDELMANAKKWRRKKMAKHKHRKRLKQTRWQRRQK